MIIESAILTLCIYGLMREGNVIKVAAIIGLLASPAILMFAKAGAERIVLLLLVLEAVPFAFALLLAHVYDKRDYRVMWE